MNFFDIKQAVDDAKQTLKAADDSTLSMLRLCKGRLRNVGKSFDAHETLKQIKRELADYNCNTGKWKEEK